MRRLLLAAAALAALAFAPDVAAQAQTGVRGTKHNLSSNSGNTVRAADAAEDEVCVFCHTPHGATTGVTPLWNRQVDGASSYDMYQSMSMDASKPSAPGGASKLCLSCHDGTIALGNVNVLNGTQPTAAKDANDIAMRGTVTTMPADTQVNTQDSNRTMTSGEGQYSGFTRLIGSDLTNDHPISITYNSTTATNDKELRSPPTAYVFNRIDGDGVHQKPDLPLDGNQLQCTTCHDPHIATREKFLRMSRLQKKNTSPGASFDVSQDQICLACHNKAGWPESAHANKDVANELYLAKEAGLREFYNGSGSAKTYNDVTVAQAGCLNCHDTHTAPGSRRLLREGIMGAKNTMGARLGNNANNRRPSIENTCFQCHSSSTDSVLQSNTSVPNIKDEFFPSTWPGTAHYRMPIDSYVTVNGVDTEAHDIGDVNGWVNPSSSQGVGADFVESPIKLGYNASANRHVECTDCHNPHRVRKRKLFTDTTDHASEGTHNHAAGHTNAISGVLYGQWGVEPSYPATSGLTSWGDEPTYTLSKNIKRGIPGDVDGNGVPIAFNAAASALDQSGVTREYQICLKCHSNFAYGNTPPALKADNTTGLTPSSAMPAGTGGIQKYTDQAREFRAPDADRGAKSAAPYNHRSWHPVMRSTGRDLSARGMGTSSPWLAPWTDNVGSQTMYCSDCHGNSNGSNANVDPTNGVWGPHGSSRPFILKGIWDINTGEGDDANQLCFKCHAGSVYGASGGSGSSGFAGGGKGNLHLHHRDKISGMRCTMCHVAVPHGWRNKALLVNLDEVGGEVPGDGTSCCSAVAGGNNAPTYTKAPYYNSARLRVKTWGKSGSWSTSNCVGNWTSMKDGCTS